MVRKGILAIFESSNISETGEAMPNKIGVHAFDIFLLAWIFWADSNWFNFLTTMDYKSMVRKGNLAVFESSNISETREAMPTKTGVHAFDINPYMHEFFDLIPIN